MNPERWQLVNQVFQSALELDTGEREKFLDDACREDASLRDQVETLLAANDQAGNFMTGNVAGDVDHLLNDGMGESEPGEKIGQYEVVSVLGKGGMGKVYLAKDPRLNRLVALKTLPPVLSSAGNYFRRFQTEAKAAANINHPNVATVYSVEETEEHRIFITMEYVEGRPLGESIPSDGLDIRTFLELFVPLADALSVAHHKGVIHRDIKPGNIMLTEAGVPKILDFGLARFEKADIAENTSTLDLTKTGQVLGTPSYMSPEQAEGSQIDRRTDIFSFGIVMYEAVTGRKPFEGDNYAAVVSKLLTTEPRDVNEINPRVPQLLSRLIMKCLNREPRHRYQSMNEVRVILEEIQSAVMSGASLSRGAPRMKFGHPSRFREALLAAFALLFLVAAGLFGVLWYYGGEAVNDTPVRFSVDPPIDQQIRLFEADLSRDGKLLVFATRSNGVRNLFVRSLERFEMTPVPGTDDAHFPFFSPDSRSIAYFLDDGSIKRVPIEGGEARTICTDCEDGSYGHWGLDGFIYASDEKGVFRVSAEGGVPERLTDIADDPADKSHRAPKLLPAGTRVLFSKVGRDTAKFAVVDVGTKEITVIEGLDGEVSAHGGISLARYVKTGHLLYSNAGRLFAVRFDPATARIDGSPVPVIDGAFAIPNFRVAENGTLAYLPEASMGENQLMIVGRSGGAQTAVQQRGDFRSPKFSPDGLKIAVELSGDVWIFEPETGRSLRLTFDGSSQSPVWSADGSSVLWATRSDSDWRIYRRSADGSDEPEQLYSGEAKLLPYSSHPTQPLVALASMPKPGASDIAVLSLQDRSIRQVVDTEFKEDSPRFSPDGSKLAYFSNESGKVEIYVIQWSENSASDRTLVSTAGGIYPVWGGSGNELLYRSGKRMMSSVIGSGNTAERPTALFEGDYLTGFDSNSDGTRFVMVKNEGGTMPKKMNIVLNWTSELQRQIPSGR
ncbi:MAG: hypothetical protein DWQ47_14010 [Acidobacteria bacterium]|nr:MAG: hypothetical protein DWQ32_01410 [Acidobacteriota bacterium]REK02815.1 MAG: hypothetical protein DWQ38_10725 [Acidobacteriota bacterium]REK13381.1 MAG: hypothetical protein DWQ43_07100 [Acidobacteriota bacterium]REK41375.1 MAG: hypothetical protein DWQ47_14010 [Acidobacteriota bacterium]